MNLTLSLVPYGNLPRYRTFSFAALAVCLFLISSYGFSQTNNPRTPGNRPSVAPGERVSPAGVPRVEQRPIADEDVTQLDPVTAFGRFNEERTVLNSAVPIDSITSLELRGTGYTETSQALQALVPSFNFPRPTLTDGTDHIRPATLRALAPDQVLVLVNGKRRHSSALVNVNGTVGRGSVSVDFNALPPTSISGVEVLRDGAAAQYGSDAIAGVIDLKLRTDIGYEATTTVGSTYAGDGDVIEAALDAGVKLGGSGFVHVSSYFRNRHSTNRTGNDFRQQYFGIRNGAPIVFPVTSPTSNIPVLQPGDSFDSREAAFNRHDSQLGDAESKEKGVLVNSEGLLTKSIRGYAFGGFTRRNSRAAANFRRSLDNSNIRSIFPDGFLPFIEAQVTDKSVTAGAKDLTKDWTWDLSQTWGSNNLRYEVDHTVNGSLGAASPTHFYAGRLFFQQATTNLDITHQFDFGWNSPLRVALGTEYRWENYRIRQGEPDSYRNGGARILDGPFAGSATVLPAPGSQGFPGFQPSDRVNPARGSYAVYYDMENQVTKRFYASVAARYEKYSDFGSTLNSKIAGRFEVSKQLSFRGSASTGFRAPSLAQSYFSQTATVFIGGAPFEVRTFPVTSSVAKLLGAVDLKPEKSTNYSIGSTLQLADSFAASIDFYEIYIDDRIAYSSNFNDAGTRNFLIGQGYPTVAGARFFTNAIDTKTRGFDLTGRYLIKTQNAGSMVLTAGININQQRLRRVASTPSQLSAVSTIPLIDRIETTRYEKGQPQNAINLASNYQFGKWSVVLREVRYGKATTVGNAIDTTRDQTVRAKWLTDINIGYSILRSLTINIGANNVFNVYPDPVLPANNPSGFVKYSFVSPFGYNGGFYYMRINYRF